MVGWIICVEDSVAKDKATKLVRGDRETAEAKRDSLQEKYDAIQKNRFRVVISAPVNEIELESQAKVKFTLPDELDSSLMMRVVSEIDPFLVSEDENMIELDSNMLPDLEQLVRDYNEKSETGGLSFQVM